MSGWSSTAPSSNERTATPFIPVSSPQTWVCPRYAPPPSSSMLPAIDASPSSRYPGSHQAYQRWRVQVGDHSKPVVVMIIWENSLHTQGRPAVGAWLGHAKDSIPSVLAKTCLTSPAFTTACRWVERVVCWVDAGSDRSAPKHQGGVFHESLVLLFISCIWLTQTS